MCFYIKNVFLVKEVALKSPKILMRPSLVDKYCICTLSTLYNQGMIKIIKITKKNRMKQNLQKKKMIPKLRRVKYLNVRPFRKREWHFLQSRYMHSY